MSKRKLPLSMTGDNMHSFECEPTGRTCNYAVCQHTVWAFKEGRLKGFEDCRSEINKRACPAIKMMLEERKAGKSLYFSSYEARVKEREKLRIEQASIERNQWRKERMLASDKKVDEEEIKRRDQELRARIQTEHDDALPPKAVKRREATPVDLNSDTGNMFAEIVNAMISEQ